MKEIKLREKWLRQVGRKNSGSIETAKAYNYGLDEFLKFVESTEEEINVEWLRAWDTGNQRDRERFYAKHLDLIETYITHLEEKEYATSVIVQRVAVAMSFYHSLRNNKMHFDFKSIKPKIQYHNRDITKEELVRILEIVGPRERAFYTLMSQGGLTPITLSKLRYKHLKEDYEAGKIPMYIDIPEGVCKATHQPHFTFVGSEAVEYLKQYLAWSNREQLGDEDYIFLPTRKDRRGDTTVDSKSLGIIFSQTVRKLKLLPESQYIERKGKPKQLRMYCLRKYFRKYAGLAGVDFVNFWMGHKLNYREQPIGLIPPSDEHYFSKDPEHHRKIYEKYAMANLRLREEKINEALMNTTFKELEEKLRKEITEQIKKNLAEQIEKYGYKAIEDSKPLEKSDTIPKRLFEE